MTQKHPGEMGDWALGKDQIGDYMRRWFFWCPWFGIRLHHILRSDAGRDFHDHPWDFASLILRGYYVEHNPDRSRSPNVFHRFSVVRHKAKDLHRLELTDGPVWTLVFTGPKRKSWGFMTKDGMVPWRTYLGVGQ